MAHVTLQYDKKGLIPRFARMYATRQFGKVVEPAAAASNHNGVLLAMGALETAAGKRWRKLDRTIQWLAIEACSGQIGCSWCLDYGYYEGMQHGVDPAKVRSALHWRESDVFDERERAVLEYAERATATPVHMPEELVDRLHAHFSDEQMVELAALVALENFRSRFNAGLGLKSEGFADQCELPLRAVPAAVAQGSERKASASAAN